jgi:hypothetical protein
VDGTHRRGRRTSTSGRNDRPYDPVRLDGVVVWFEKDMAVDNVTIGWTPLTGFDVTWPGTIHEELHGAEAS